MNYEYLSEKAKKIALNEIKDNLNEWDFSEAPKDEYIIDGAKENGWKFTEEGKIIIDN